MESIDTMKPVVFFLVDERLSQLRSDAEGLRVARRLRRAGSTRGHRTTPLI